MVEVVRAWMCGLKNKVESKVIPRQWTWTGKSMESLTVTNSFAEGIRWDGGKMIRQSGILESREVTTGPER